MTAPQGPTGHKDSPNELGPEPPYMYVVDAGLLAWLRECAREPMYSKGFGRAAEAIQALQQRAELAERRADDLARDLREQIQRVDHLDRLTQCFRLEQLVLTNGSLVRELEHFKSSGIIEVAIRNASVSEYMRHWEGRTETAERQVAELRGVLKAAAAFIESDGDNLGILDGCDGYFQWDKVYAPLRPRIAAALSEQTPEQKT